MVEGRPDWLISRQRAWGTPLAMFVDRKTGEPLRDPEVNARITSAIAEAGADAWFTRPSSDFLGAERDPEDFEKVEDILDVWFDSGSTHAFTLEGRNDSRWPADLYLEGSDQARGWFQSSLLEACGTRGRAPYDAVLTHGFTLDEQGEKMSKSKGNTVDPLKVINESGAEILRLWVAMVDYAEDQRIGKAILQTATDGYRKFRNTLRYLLGALQGFEESERVAIEQMPPLEKYGLHRLWQLDAQVRAAYVGYRFNDVWRPVSEFAAQELSALYFDIRKDALYCDAPSSIRRRAARTVMHEVFERLTIWLAPILPFTCEEAWTTRYPDAGPNSLRIFPETPDGWRNEIEAERWTAVGGVLDVVTGALEVERREKRIGAALEAAPQVHLARVEDVSAFEGLDAAEVFRTSQAKVDRWPEPTGLDVPTVAPVQVHVHTAEGEKCARCWRILPEVRAPRFLCQRCDAALAEIEGQA
jgi:isoleucyl-tRNA synthetase